MYGNTNRQPAGNGFDNQFSYNMNPPPPAVFYGGSSRVQGSQGQPIVHEYNPQAGQLANQQGSPRVQVNQGQPIINEYNPQTGQLVNQQPISHTLLLNNSIPLQGVAGQAENGGFMTRPSLMPGVPQGLEYLTQLDQVLVHQQMELFEMMTGYQTKNRYLIKNVLGQQVYFAGEESDVCQRQCCGAERGFVIHVTDNAGQEVIRVRREFKCFRTLPFMNMCFCCCSLGCCSCVRLELEVEAPVGQVCGYIRQRTGCGSAKLEVLDAQEQTVLNIAGPNCVCESWCCPTDKEFKILSADGADQLGLLTKQWGGLYVEMMSMADKFSATFPRDLDVRMKAVIVGAVFFIDFMYFENKNNGGGGRRRGGRRRRRY